MSNWIGPTVKQLWNYAMDVLHNILGLTQTQQLFAWANPAFISYYQRAPWTSLAKSICYCTVYNINDKTSYLR